MSSSMDYSGSIRWLAVQKKADEMQIAQPDWRRGQALFNALHWMDSILANQIRNTSADPYNNDSRECVQEFVRAVVAGYSHPRVREISDGLKFNRKDRK